MRRCCKIVTLSCLACSIAGIAWTGQEDAELDDKIVAAIGNVLSRRDGIDARTYRRLFDKCHSDSNRLCNIAQRVYAEYPDYFSRTIALSLIGEYGDARQVIFLESCVTNVALGPAAISALNRIEGFTSNSVLRTARYHSVTNQEVFGTDKKAYSDRDWALKKLVFSATRPSVDVALKNFARDYVFSYASNNCYQICTADRALMSLDSTYKNSRRRLALLRLAQPVVPGPYSPEYVTNAINELVAYPEANLPE